MNANTAAPEANWVQIAPGDYEWQSEHAYYRAKRNDVIKGWALGKRLHPDWPIKLIGVFPTLKVAKERAAADGASL